MQPFDIAVTGLLADVTFVVTDKMTTVGLLA